MKILFPIFVIALFSNACIHVPAKNSESVRLHFFIKDAMDNAQLIGLEQQCENLGEVVGNQGHWYDYLFLANKAMVQGALIDIKNEAHQMGANVVVIHNENIFITSVTFLGQAYHCKIIP